MWKTKKKLRHEHSIIQLQNKFYISCIKVQEYNFKNTCIKEDMIDQ